MTKLGIVGDHPWKAGWQYLRRWFWIMGDQPKADRWPSWGCWVTILVHGRVGDHPDGAMLQCYTHFFSSGELAQQEWKRLFHFFENSRSYFDNWLNYWYFLMEKIFSWKKLIFSFQTKNPYNFAKNEDIELCFLQTSNFWKNKKIVGCYTFSSGGS